MPLDTNIYAASRGGPSAAYAPGVDYGSASDATTFNINNADQVSKLSDLINSINTKAQQAANAARIPGAAALETKSSNDINNELSGQVPADVISLLQQQAAERGVGTGVGVDSSNTNSAYLKALGLTSLGQIQAGQTNLTAAYQRNPGAPVFDAGTQVITPKQGADLSLQQQQLELAKKAEADRLAIEKEQLALEALLKGGKGGGPTGQGTGGGNYVTPADVNYTQPGLTGNSVTPDVPFTTNSWWAKTGITPGTGVLPGTGTTYMGDNPNITSYTDPQSTAGYDVTDPSTYYDYTPANSGDGAAYG